MTVKINEFADHQIIERVWNRGREHLVVAILTPDEAEAIAGALGSHDAAATILYDMAAECRALDEARR